MEKNAKREEKLRMLAEKIQASGKLYPDIRKKEWGKLNCDAARLLNLLISAEDILINFDEYQMENGQCYPEIEDMMLEISELRAKYTKFVEKNNDVLNIELM